MPRSPRALVILCFLIIYCVWGSTFLAIRYGLEAWPPFLMGGFRFLVASAVLGAWVQARGLTPRARVDLGRTILSGVLLGGLGNGMVIYGEQGVPSGLASLWIATVPVWVFLLNWIFFDRRTPRFASGLGALIGVSGIALLPGVTAQMASSGGAPMRSIGALLLAALSWSVGTLLTSHNPRKGPPFWTTAVQMGAAGIFLTLLGSVSGEWARVTPAMLEPRPLLSVLYLAILGSVVAYSAYTWLLGHVVPQKVSTYALINPVLALLLGFLAAGEPMNGRLIAASAVVLVGVSFILFAPRAARP